MSISRFVVFGNMCKFFAISMFSVFIAHTAAAQTDIITPSPNLSTYLDQNGVDLLNGASEQTTDMVSIGSGSDGLATSVTTRNENVFTHNRSSYLGTINFYTARGYVVSLGESSEEFTLSGSTYTPKRANGSTLTYNGGLYTYITANGTVAVFDSAIKTENLTTVGTEINTAAVTSITSPSGRTLTFTYDEVVNGSTTFIYLRSVQNNLGYQLKFKNFNNEVTAINNSVDYCSPTAATCSLPAGRWAEASYEPPTGR